VNAPVLFLWHMMTPHPERLVAILQALRLRNISAEILVFSVQDKEMLSGLLDSHGQDYSIHCFAPLHERIEHKDPLSTPTSPPEYLTQNGRTQWRPNELMLEDLASAMQSFDVSLAVADFFLEKIKPCALVFNIEYLEYITASISMAHRREIPVVCMQHAGGDYEQYANMPVTADYYVAYNAYNQSVLENIRGLDAKRIVRTGLPDLSSGVPLEKTLDRMPGDRPLRILITLRPYVQPSFAQYRPVVKEFISKISAALEKIPDKQVVIRRHPRERAIEADLPSNNLSGLGNWIDDDTERSISETLVDVDILITMNSSVVTDAMSNAVPALIVDWEDGAVWPDWQDGHAYRQVTMNEFDDALANIVDGKWPLASHVAASLPLRKRFDNQRGPGAAEKMAEFLIEIAEKPKKIQDWAELDTFS